jgi:hypothetical protein
MRGGSATFYTPNMAAMYLIKSKLANLAFVAALPQSVLLVAAGAGPAHAPHSVSKA